MTRRAHPTDWELADTLQESARRRGADMAALAEAIDPDALNRLAAAICPESVLPASELVAHVYRVALDTAAAKAKRRTPHQHKEAV